MLNMQSPSTITRLRIVPADDTGEVDETRRALRDGYEILRREGNPKPSLKEVIWRLLQDASETLSRLPDRERAWLLGDRVQWPELARPSEECRQVETEQRNNILAGSDEYGKRHTWGINGYRPRFAITDPSAENRMLIVLSWMRYIKAKNRKRDWLILLEIARGTTYHRAAKIFSDMGGRDIGGFAILAIKRKLLRQIEQRVLHIDL